MDSSSSIKNSKDEGKDKALDLVSYWIDSKKQRLYDDDDDGWETESFIEFDGLMSDVDLFDTTSTPCLGMDFVRLLYRKLATLTAYEVRKVDNISMHPVFHGTVYYKDVEQGASFAVSSYNEIKGKNLHLVQAYKANMISHIYCDVFFISLYAIDNGLKRAFRTCVLCPHARGAPKMSMWSFKAMSFHSPVMEFQYQKEDDDEGGWETESFKDFPAFNWDLLDYRRCCPDKKTRDMVNAHTNEVRRSKGFDVSTFHPSTRYRWLRPITSDCPLAQQKLITTAAQFAVDQYNYRTGKKLKFENVFKTNVTSSVRPPVVGGLYFITLDAVDTSIGRLKRFQTHVLVEPNGKSMRVRYFKSKPA